MTRLARLLALSVALVVMTAGCGGDDKPALEKRSATGAGAATVVGEDLRFDVSELRAAAGQELVITFENRDAGVPHNLHVDGGAAGQFTTEVENGPITQTLRVRIDTPGSYEYVCDVHVATMRGTLVVS